MVVLDVDVFKLLFSVCGVFFELFGFLRRGKIIIC